MFVGLTTPRPVAGSHVSTKHDSVENIDSISRYDNLILYRVTVFIIVEHGE